MDRRDFLKSTSAAALAAGTATTSAAHEAKAADDAAAVAAPAIVPARRALRMVSLWPDAVTGPGDHVRRFAKRIEAATDGRWVIKIADQPIAGADAFKAVMTGEADLYIGHEHAHRDLHPAFSYFAGLPCGTGMDIDRMNAWLVAGGGQELWDELAAEFNMKGLIIGHTDPLLDGTGYAISLGLRRSYWDGLANSERILLSALAGEALTACRADTRAEALFLERKSMAVAATPFGKRPELWQTGQSESALIESKFTRIAETIVTDTARHDEHSRRISASYMAFKGTKPAKPMI